MAYLQNPIPPRLTPIHFRNKYRRSEYKNNFTAFTHNIARQNNRSRRAEQAYPRAIFSVASAAWASRNSRASSPGAAISISPVIAWPVGRVIAA